MNYLEDKNEVNNEVVITEGKDEKKFDNENETHKPKINVKKKEDYRQYSPLLKYAVEIVHNGDEPRQYHLLMNFFEFIGFFVYDHNLENIDEEVYEHAYTIYIDCDKEIINKKKNSICIEKLPILPIDEDCKEIDRNWLYSIIEQMETTNPIFFTEGTAKDWKDLVDIFVKHELIKCVNSIILIDYRFPKEKDCRYEQYFYKIYCRLYMAYNEIRVLSEKTLSIFTKYARIYIISKINIICRKNCIVNVFNAKEAAKAMEELAIQDFFFAGYEVILNLNVCDNKSIKVVDTDYIVNSFKTFCNLIKGKTFFNEYFSRVSTKMYELLLFDRLFRAGEKNYDDYIKSLEGEASSCSAEYEKYKLTSDLKEYEKLKSKIEAINLFLDKIKKGFEFAYSCDKSNNEAYRDMQSMKNYELKKDSDNGYYTPFITNREIIKRCMDGADGINILEQIFREEFSEIWKRIFEGKNYHIDI